MSRGDDMNPELVKKLEEERARMTQEERQTVALERIADILVSINGKLAAIQHNTRQ
jgi:hypothetical protein